MTECIKSELSRNRGSKQIVQASILRHDRSLIVFHQACCFYHDYSSTHGNSDFLSFTNSIIHPDEHIRLLFVKIFDAENKDLLESLHNVDECGISILDQSVFTPSIPEHSLTSSLQRLGTIKSIFGELMSFLRHLVILGNGKLVLFFHSNGVWMAML